MSEFTRALGRFFGRDFIYILGGNIFIFLCIGENSFRVKILKEIENFEQLSTEITLTAFIVFLGLTWALGYLLQDGLGLLIPALTTSSDRQPKGIAKWLYRRFTTREFSAESQDTISNKLCVQNYATELQINTIERITLLKHVGKTLGAAFLLGGLFNVLVMNFNSESLPYIGVISVILGSLFEGLGALKNAQEQVLYMDTANAVRPN